MAPRPSEATSQVSTTARRWSAVQSPSLPNVPSVVCMRTTLGAPGRSDNRECSLVGGLGRAAYETVLHGEHRRPGPGRDPDLPVDVLDVVVGRLDRDRELVCDL